ncbi:MAG: hypothetical protein MZV64_23040 [Ignavibacteriales bacterium]|nr:hypothetical protein [Ignavibacteriales bacterium]
MSQRRIFSKRNPSRFRLASWIDPGCDGHRAVPVDPLCEHQPGGYQRLRPRPANCPADFHASPQTDKSQHRTHPLHLHAPATSTSCAWSTLTGRAISRLRTFRRTIITRFYSPLGGSIVYASNQNGGYFDLFLFVFEWLAAHPPHGKHWQCHLAQLLARRADGPVRQPRRRRPHLPVEGGEHGQKPEAVICRPEYDRLCRLVAGWQYHCFCHGRGKPECLRGIPHERGRYRRAATD